jgi:hypothetical protein
MMCISILVLLIIGLHSLPALQELSGKRQTFWPIMAWGMFRKSYDSDRPIKTSIKRILAITAQDEVLQISAWDAGLGHYGFQRLYVNPMAAGNALAARHLAAQINRGRDDSIVKLILQIETYILHKAGLGKEDVSIVTYWVGD